MFLKTLNVSNVFKIYFCEPWEIATWKKEIFPDIWLELLIPRMEEDLEGHLVSGNM
jgi:hypothetical protein